MIEEETTLASLTHELVWSAPTNWGAKKLSLIAKEVSQQIRPSDNPVQTYNYWSLDAISRGQFEEPLPNYVAGSAIESTCVKFDDNHILYSKLRPYLNKVVVPSTSGIGTTEWIVVQPDSDLVDRKYLAYVLRSPAFLSYTSQGGNTSGARMPRLRKQALWNFDVPLPYPDDPVASLQVQRAIVARIESLLAELREIRELHAVIGRDVAQVMGGLLSEIFPSLDRDMPLGWSLKTVKELSSKPQYGYTQSATDQEVGPKFLRITDIQNGMVDWDKVPYCEISPNNEKKYLLGSGDIVFARSGATTGKTYLLSNPPRSVFASYLIRLQTRGVLPGFVFWFFQSPDYWRQVIPKGAAQPNMNATLLQEVKVPVPNSDEVQRQIVAYINTVRDELQEMHKIHSVDNMLLDQVEQAILEQAFRGEL